MKVKVILTVLLQKNKQTDANKSLFGGMFSGLSNNIGDVEGPARENWQFCVFQVRKRKYNILKNGISSKLNIPLGPEDETLIMCLNFSDQELKTLLVDMLKVEPIIYYECMLQSPVDKVYEFDDGSIFYNMIINRENFTDTPLILRMIRKNNFAVVVMNQEKGDTFMLSTEIATKFNFKEVIKPKFPKLFKRRRALNRAKNSPSVKPKSNKSKETEEEVEQENIEVAGVTIRRIRTIKPINENFITIDYLLFWISSEGLKKIENFINMKLLYDVNEIREQSKNMTIEEKEFLHIVDVFENLYIGVQNAKNSKESYFEKIFESKLASKQFRNLIRHLKSRIINLSNTTFIIERKFTVARNTFQMSIDSKMSENAERLDKLMRQFSLISVMFLPLSLITGMWGMNCKVPYMLQDPETDDANWFFVL